MKLQESVKASMCPSFPMAATEKGKVVLSNIVETELLIFIDRTPADLLPG